MKLKLNKEKIAKLTNEQASSVNGGGLTTVHNITLHVAGVLQVQIVITVHNLLKLMALYALHMNKRISKNLKRLSVG